MNFFKILDTLKRQDAALIFYALLNRIPIIVCGKYSEDINNFLIELSELIHFRKEFVFYTDFISVSEYEDLIQNENIDYNSERAHIRCPCSVSLKALNRFNRFYSWIIGIELVQNVDSSFNIKKSLRKKMDAFLIINLNLDKNEVELEGINLKEIDLSLEQSFLQKISQDTEKSIAKMMRVLNEKTKIDDIDKDLMNTLLDFETEKKELKKNIIKSEMQKFFSASKRAFFILSRLNLLRSVEINTKIGNKTLLETIDYEEAPLERIISFINKEWNEDFFMVVENGKKINALDSMQSMWG
ncbi:MAG: hypothetical protein EU531_07455 [Promethearchaeota archaeon]|nr:MAG: hypothetical protein EU531_07455 [Candidatus Lokiarchaeota archaeon]